MNRHSVELKLPCFLFEDRSLAHAYKDLCILYTSNVARSLLRFLLQLLAKVNDHSPDKYTLYVTVFGHFASTSRLFFRLRRTASLAFEPHRLDLLMT